MSSSWLLLVVTMVVCNVVAFRWSIAPSSFWVVVVLVASFSVLAYLTRERKWIAFVLLGCAASFFTAHEMRFRMERANLVEGLPFKGNRWHGQVFGWVIESDRKKIVLHVSHFSTKKRKAWDSDKWDIGPVSVDYLKARKRLILYRSQFDDSSLAEDWSDKFVLCKVTLKRSERKRVPGGFDALLYRLSGVADGGGRLHRCVALKSLDDVDTPWVIQFRSRVKGQTRKLLKQIGTPKSRSTLMAMLLGEKGQLSLDMKELYRRAGLYHLLVVSGLHLGLLGVLGYFLVLFLISLYPKALFRINRRIVARLTALLVMAGYLVVVGAQPPLVRAFYLALFLVLALSIRRPFSALHALIMASGLLIFFQPFFLFSASFQLTVAATWGILFGMQVRGMEWLRGILSRWSGGSRKNGSWVGRFIASVAGLAMVSFFAFVFTLPVVVFHFHRFSLLGLIANVIYTPITGWIILPLGFAGVFLAVFWPGAAIFFFQTAAFLQEGVLSHLEFLAKLPGHDIQMASPSWFSVAAWYLFWTLLLSRSVWLWMPKRKWVLALLLFGSALPYMRSVWHPGVEATLIDVGDGSAFLLESSQPFKGREVLLFDTGPNSVCRFAVVPVLEKRGIRRIEAVYISHWEEDHAGCLGQLLHRYEIRHIYGPYDPKLSSGRRVEAIRAGFTHAYSRLTVKTLHPPLGPLPEKENNRSLVLLLSLAGPKASEPQRWLLPGDMEKKVESTIVNMLLSNHVGSLDLLLAPHHGSFTSSSRIFVEATRPSNLLVSRRRSPNHKVIQRYRKAGGSVWMTRKQGTLLLKMKGTDLTIRGFACDRLGRPHSGWGPCP